MTLALCFTSCPKISFTTSFNSIISPEERSIAYLLNVLILEKGYNYTCCCYNPCGSERVRMGTEYGRWASPIYGHGGS
ncbi:hypothetical protein J2X77_004846 [Sphingobacterium sp. 2149]|nr:hypothetical protein [Sphingobacterium sp. 2149]